MASKLLLFSVVVSIVALPALAAREPSATRGLKKAVFWLVAFNLFYLFALRVIYPRL